MSENYFEYEFDGEMWSIKDSYYPRSTDLRNLQKFVHDYEDLVIDYLESHENYAMSYYYRGDDNEILEYASMYHVDIGI